MTRRRTQSCFPGASLLAASLFLNGCANSADSPVVILERARILLDRDQVEESVPLFSEAIAAMPEDAEARYLRGLAYEKLNVLERALEDYSECLRLDEDRPDALNNKAVVLAKLERFEEAAEQFTRLVNVDPQDALAYRNRGLCHFDLEHYELALLDYDKAIQLAPKESAGWFQRGNVFLEQSEYLKAIDDYTQAISLDKDSAKAWMNRGVARYQNDEKSLAAEDLKMAQSLDDNIILPGLDFFAEVPQETATVSQESAWPVLRAIAEKNLAERGFTDLAIVQEFPAFLCAEIKGVFAAKSKTVLLACCPQKQAFLTLPSPASTSGNASNGLSCCLLILELPESGDLNAVVSHFETNWNVGQQVSQPLIIRCDRPQNPD